MNIKRWKKIWTLVLIFMMFFTSSIVTLADEIDEEIEEEDPNDEIEEYDEEESEMDEDGEFEQDDEEEDEGEDDDKDDEDEEHDEDEDNDDIDDDREDFEERDINILAEGDKVEIESEWENKDSEDELRIIISSDEGLIVELEYDSEFNDTETELEFTISIERIIEYNDTNGNHRYDEDDEVISVYNLEDAIFNDINYTVRDTVDNESVHIFSVNTTDDVFGIVMYAVGSFAELESGILMPSEMKMDFIINYDFLNNNTDLALKVDVNTEHEIETDVDTYDESQGYGIDESELSIFTDGYFGFFSWVDYALVDGVNRTVNTTFISEVEFEGDEDEYELERNDVIYFCYPRGENIVHDPKVGVVSQSSLLYMISPSDGLPMIVVFYAFGMIIAVFMVGSSVYMSYKKNNKGKK